MSAAQSTQLEKIRDVAVTQFDDTASQFVLEYERMADDYFWSAFTYGRRKIDRLMTQALRGVPAGGKVLDVGCGTGEQLAQFHRLGFDATGIEPADEMRAIASGRNAALKVMPGSVLSLPFESESFDLVVGLEVLRYLHRNDVARAYAEMVRVLRPGGCLFITLVNRFALDGFYLYDKLKRLATRRIRHKEPLHNEFVTPGQVRRDLTKLAVDEIDIRGQMLAPLRIVYRLNRSLGARVARRLESFDDKLAQKPWMTPFGGHLIVVARRSR